jgi:NAD/NADP transhydrogenase beta subunit
MNRSITHVLVGGFGDGAGSKVKKAKKAEGTVTEVSAEDVVEMMTEAKSIIIAPGYGELHRIHNFSAHIF